MTTWRSRSSSQLTEMSSPPLHSGLLRARKIRYEPRRAIRDRVPLSFCWALMPTRLQMVSRMRAFLLSINLAFICSQCIALHCSVISSTEISRDSGRALLPAYSTAHSFLISCLGSVAEVNLKPGDIFEKLWIEIFVAVVNGGGYLPPTWYLREQVLQPLALWNWDEEKLQKNGREAPGKCRVMGS